MNYFLRGGSRIIISTSTNVYTNLALERFLAENIQHQPKSKLLILWRNSPSIVIGRYQNPYVESNLNYLFENNILLSRRYSGGGTTYHDEGNLNLTILTTRDNYNRRKNLEWLVSTINDSYVNKFSLHITKRDDIILEDSINKQQYKITGSASRLTRTYAYHHFTLLINTNLNHLRQSLKSNDRFSIKSNATESIRSSVTCLSNYESTIQYETLIDILAKSFWKQNQQTKWGSDYLYDYIDPQLFQNQLKQFIDELKSDYFLYEVTPPFTYTILAH
ncbi:unnamed protein product, partial [Didymodactylos carnosus]